MRKSLIAITALLAIFLAGCKKEEGKFHIVGYITDAKDTMLYLEHLTLDRGPVPIDSAKLGKDGSFALSGKPVGNPEFYRLRIGEQLINLSVDSTETITVEASLPTMSLGYKVEGSGNCDTIRMLTRELHQLGQTLHGIADDRSLTIAERELWPYQPRTDNLCNIALRGHRNTHKRVIEVNLDDDNE